MKLSCEEVMCSSFQLNPMKASPRSGSPAMIPLKSAGYFSASINPSRPPSEQPAKYECGCIVERSGNGFICHGDDMDGTKQPIVLFSRIVERPTAVEKRKISRSLMPGIGDGSGETGTYFRQQWSEREI